MSNDGGSAFPKYGDEILDAGSMQPSIRHFGGMSLRQWYAGMAASGFFANPYAGKNPVPSDEEVAQALFKFADAMIAEGKK